MKKIINKLFRNDLDLNKYWWHRLSKVAFLLILVASVIISTYIIWRNNSRFYHKPNQHNYYEISGTLSDYISKHSGEYLMKLEKIRDTNVFILDKEIFGYEEHKIGDIIDKDEYYGYNAPYWLISENSNNIKRLRAIECKEGITVDDVKKYKSSSHHYDTKYYSRASEKCEFFPSNDLLFEQDIKKNLQTPSNCILSDNSCMYTIGKDSNFMDGFLIVSQTEKSEKYSKKLYHEEMTGYYKEWSKWFFTTLLKNILISVGITAAIAILLLIIYYKGFIYIIYGGKKK